MMRSGQVTTELKRSFAIEDGKEPTVCGLRFKLLVLCTTMEMFEIYPKMDHPV